MHEISTASLGLSARTPNEGTLRDTAQKLEATFLSEMLKSAGYGEMETTFGGGAGEQQFASFLRDAQSMRMVEAGGLGLAETFFRAMKEMQNAEN